MLPIAIILNLKIKNQPLGKERDHAFNNVLKFGADRIFLLESLGSSSITFTGNSFVKYRLMENENKLEMKLTMRLRTYSSHAVVMYARGTDYSILEVCVHTSFSSGCVRL